MCIYKSDVIPSYTFGMMFISQAQVLVVWGSRDLDSSLQKKTSYTYTFRLKIVDIIGKVFMK